jgi:hypothetical protein
MTRLQTRERERERERGGQNSVTNCRSKRVSPSWKTKREQSISKEKIKKERKRERSKEKGGRCFVFAATCLPLRNTRVAAEIDSYGDPKEQKTNECFTQCERDREKKKRDSEQVRGGRRWRALFCVHMESAKPTWVAKPTCVHVDVAKNLRLWLSLATFTLRWPSQAYL